MFLSTATDNRHSHQKQTILSNHLSKPKVTKKSELMNSGTSWDFPSNPPYRQAPSPPSGPSTSPGSRAAEAALSREKDWQKEERRKRREEKQRMKDEAPNIMGRMRKAIFGNNKHKLSKIGKQPGTGNGLKKPKKTPQKYKENGGANKKEIRNEKAASTRRKASNSRSKPASLKSAAASLKSRVGSIKSRVKSNKSRTASIKSTIRQELDDVKAKIKKSDTKTSDNDSPDSRSQDEEDRGEYGMSGGLDSEIKGDRAEYESEDDMVRDVDPERRNEQRRRRRRQARRMRSRRRQERRAKRRGTSESESSEASEYYVSYGPVGRWGCLVM
ncbi:hypothetical protein V493_02643 [Pseudogymnoascus sp. VKM F-4281 (FW-2241)]|nr:hypothetical protein V493_02643 [Pseudogymnoascus sp. VKM F-4281 (FW-2241)]